MRISHIETFVLGNRSMLVKISTSDGHVGWGEPILENWARAVEGAVLRLAERLIGADPRRVTALWQVLARGGFYRGGAVLASAVAGLDQALWDLKARALGVPIHEMLGGPVRDRLRVYGHANRDGRLGDPVKGRTLAKAGLTLLKVAPERVLRFIESPAVIDGLVDQLEEFRDAVGGSVDIAVDAHGRFSTAMSRRFLRRTEHLGLAFVEEPVRPEHSHRLRDIVESTSTPIATGERLYSREEFLAVLGSGIAIAQPDLSHAGGITEVMRIGTLAESFDVQLAPHCPLGPVALAACLQVGFALPNVYAQEQSLQLHSPGSDDALRLIRNPEVLGLVDGMILRPTGPGLGVEVDEEAVRAGVVEGEPTQGPPVWTDTSGAFAEW